MKSANHPFTSPELEADLSLRHKHLRELMRRDGIQAMLITDNTNIFYIAGRVFRGYVYLPLVGETIMLVIRPAVDNAPDSVYIRKPEQIPDTLTAHDIKLPQNIALEYSTLSYAEYLRLVKIFPDAEILNASPILAEARLTKTPYELQQMTFNGVHQVNAYSRISRLYKEGMTDIEFQIEIERELRREGSLGYLRVAGKMLELNMGSVLAGENADEPGPYDSSMGGHGTNPSLPVGANGTIIRPGMSVMVDMNGNFNGYQTDLTRVWSPGKLPEKALLAHNISIRILRRLEELGRPGVAIDDLARAAYDLVEQNNLTEYFMGHRQKAPFIGHGVGIELNEQPVIRLRSTQTLLENMTIALEPKFVIPKVGAVGVENTYVVTQKGLKNLTPFHEEILPLDGI